MPLVNHSKREINVKVVYAGLPHAGKSTNLKNIYQRLKPEFRGQSRSITMGDCVMQLCEFQPPGVGVIPGFTMKYHLYTLSGEGADDTQWRMIFKGADGIVFVADARADKSGVNRTAFSELLRQLNNLGIDLSQVPIIVQCNHQDAPGALDPSALEQVLSVPGLTIVPGIASRGDGVLETLMAAVRKISAQVQKMEVTPVELVEYVEHEDAPDTIVDEITTRDAAHSVHNESATALDAADSAHLQALLPNIVQTNLAPDGEPIQIPISLTVAGIDKHFVLTLSIREAGSLACEPLCGAAYVR